MQHLRWRGRRYIEIRLLHAWDERELRGSVYRFYFSRCYGIALRINDSDASLWHDLGINLYLQGKILERAGKEENETKDLFERALATLKKSLSLDPQNGKIWDSLGVVASHKGKIKFKVM